MKKSVVVIGMAVLMALVVSGIVARAGMIPLSVSREVGVSGFAGGSAYSQVQSWGGTGGFAKEVSGEANASNPVVSWPLAGSAHAESVASQESFVGSELITASGSLRAETWVGFDAPAGGNTTARAHSLFSATFQVFEPLAYEFRSWQDWFIDGENLPYLYLGGNPQFLSFTSLSGDSVVGTLANIRNFNFSFSGILLPDTYTLRYGSEMFGFKDPLGDLAGLSYRLSLTTANVPDGGSTLLLLGMGFVAVLGIGRRVVA